MSTENAGRVDATRPETQDRIVPEAPSNDSEGAESLDVWGFADSGFEMNEGGDLIFRGTRG